LSIHTLPLCNIFLWVPIALYIYNIDDLSLIDDLLLLWPSLIDDLSGGIQHVIQEAWGLDLDGVQQKLAHLSSVLVVNFTCSWLNKL
jgi:hypothetical protein